MIKKDTILLVLILVLALFLRVFNLGTVPLGLSEDEASIGYNAYSLAKTGRDETGKLLPLYFESFGDYKSPLAVYLTAPFVLLGGLNETTTRLPAALSGVFLIIIIFVLSKRIFEDKWVGVIASFLVAISPWGVHLSRFDTPFSMALTLLSLQLLLITSNYSFRPKCLLQLIIVIMLLVTHPASWVISVPLFSIWLIKESWGKWRNLHWMTLSLVGVLTVFLLSFKSLQYFYLQENFIKEVGFINRVNQVQGYISQSDWPLGRIFQNKVAFFTDQVFNNYLRPFDFYYLFSKSDFEERYQVYNFGKFYSLELLFFFFGAYALIKKTFPLSRNLYIIIFLAPLTQLLSVKMLPGQSMAFLIIPFYLITAFGVTKILQVKLKSVYKNLLLVGAGVIIFANVLIFFHYYFVHFPLETYLQWNNSYKLVTERIQPLLPSYQQVIISDYLAPKPYIFTLFYNKYEPQKYQQIEKQRGGSIFVSTSGFDRYRFRAIKWEEDREMQSTLLIGSEKEFPDNLIPCTLNRDICPIYVDFIKSPDGKIIFKMVGTYKR